MEFDTTANTAWLDSTEQRRHTETSRRLLAVWHSNARRNLRAIVDRTSLTRPAEAPTSGRRAVAADRGTGVNSSLTCAWRQSAGALLGRDRLRALSRHPPRITAEVDMTAYLPHENW